LVFKGNNAAPLVRSGNSAVATNVNNTAQRCQPKNIATTESIILTWQFLVYKEHHQINSIPARGPVRKLNIKVTGSFFFSNFKSSKRAK
jgi:hypothetical protein